MLLEILKDEQIVLQLDSLPAPITGFVREAPLVFFALESQRLSALGDLVPMMEILNRLFEADRYDQTNHDRRNVNEETFPRMRGFMRCVNI